MVFYDEMTLNVQAGRGGIGRVHFRRGPHQPCGRADGGHGGRGGHVWLEASSSLSSFSHYRSYRTYEAQDGKPGGSERSQGASGEDLILQVPCGTQILSENQEPLGHLLASGERFLLAQGGKGGLGNSAYQSSTNRSPQQSRDPECGEFRRVRLSLSLLADVGLIGLPSVGKSSLLNALTGAQSQVGNYPFTTLKPQLGVWTDGIYELTIADLPGLIEGAQGGRGLGLAFLRQIRLCRAFIWVLDGGEETLSCEEQKRILEEEIYAFDRKILDAPNCFVVNKIDLCHNENSFSDSFPSCLAVSVKSGLGMKSLECFLKNWARLFA